MRILILGRGTISTLYGAALEAAGHEVSFLVRPGSSAQNGLPVRMDVIDARRRRAERHVTSAYTPRILEALDPAHPFDLIIVSVAHHRLSQAAEDLAPAVGDATVLVFGNVWREPSEAIAPLPATQVVFGFPGAGGGFSDDGTLHGALLRSVVVGRTGSVASAREEVVHRAFERAGFRIRQQPDMRGWLFVHFASDAGMFAHGARGGALAGMIGRRGAFEDALRTGAELLPVLSARGVDLRRHRRALVPLRQPRLVASAMALATTRVPIARVSLAAHTDPLSAEACAIIRDSRREAERLGIATPRLSAAAELLP